MFGQELIPGQVFQFFDAVVLKVEDLEVGAHSVDVLDLFQLLQEQKNGPLCFNFFK
jgi:hypothetical protein